MRACPALEKATVMMTGSPTLAPADQVHEKELLY